MIFCSCNHINWEINQYTIFQMPTHAITHIVAYRFASIKPALIGHVIYSFMLLLIKYIKDTVVFCLEER